MNYLSSVSACSRASYWSAPFLAGRWSWKSAVGGRGSEGHRPCLRELGPKQSKRHSCSFLRRHLQRKRISVRYLNAPRLLRSHKTCCDARASDSHCVSIPEPFGISVRRAFGQVSVPLRPPSGNALQRRLRTCLMASRADASADTWFWLASPLDRRSSACLPRLLAVAPPTR